MHTRRLASLVLGGWLAGILFMMVVATFNFQVVNRVLEGPPKPARLQIDSLGKDGARMLLRYQASETNRALFDGWEWAQLGLGFLLAATLLFATNGNRLAMTLSLSMLALVAVMHWLLTPEITALGRVIDYVSPRLPSEHRESFWRYHRVYAALEIVKLLLGAGLALWLLMDSRDRTTRSRRRRGSHRRQEIDGIDDADDRHVDG